MMDRILDFAAWALPVFAGLYMLTTGGSWLQIIGTGGAIYFIGRGIGIARSASVAGEIRDLLAKEPPTVEEQERRRRLERLASG